MTKNVILVNEHDQEVGLMDKIEVHRKGLLHRAFSVFVINSHGELMLHQRAYGKYHSGGLWTNTCCSHPHYGEAVEEAAHRKLQEEMGFDCQLRKLFDFIYRINVGQRLIENELDHLFVGFYDNMPYINPKEVANWKWMNLDRIENELITNPEKYTEWFKIIFKKFGEAVKEMYGIDGQPVCPF